MRIGPFKLERAIGKGGMAIVWLARHVDLNREVALKVLIGDRARDKAYVQDMEYEIRACARMHHPGIVDIFDMGELPRDVAQKLSLQEGSPYYIMEYVEGGTLKDVVKNPGWGWGMVRQVLMDVLEALAHAHARQIVHRDLKPANILFGTQDGQLRAMLADFGVAASRDLDTETRPDLLRVTGTPKYMAPEQVQADWRNQGPWTDLYALGCIAYWMVTGSAPFVGANHIETLRAHLKEPPPPMNPTFAVPPGFRAWVMTLLNKEPSKRFQCAADAAYALNGLNDPVGSMLSPRLTNSTLPAEGNSFELLVAEASGEFSTVGQTVRPPIVADWRRGDDRKRDQRLVGAGLRLFDWRAIPFVERIAERDVIWRALQRVHQTGQPRLVLIEGEAGTGKSRLAEWISQRAEEVGAAKLLKAYAADFDPDGASLGAMVAEHFHCENLPFDRAKKRIEAGLSTMVNAERHDESLALDAFVLTQLVCDKNGEAMFLPEQDRVAASARLIERIAKSRPVIVWLDNVHLSPTVMPLVHKILQKTRVRVLFLATLRSEDIPENESLRRWVEGLSAHPSCEHLQLRSLGPEEQRELVRRLLLLDESVVTRVVKSTGGNPLFAVELIGEWIRKGQLEATKNGFALARDASLAVPTAVHDIWISRIKTIVAHFPDPVSVMTSLELAAILGEPVNAADWRKGAAYLGLALPSKLLPLLIDRHICDGNIQSFRFSQALMRDALIRHSKSSGSWKGNNKVCAELMQIGPDAGAEALARYGMHLVEAQRWEEALEPLRKSVYLASELENTEASIRLLEVHAHAIKSAGLSVNSHDALFNKCHTLWHRQRRGRAVDLAHVRDVRRRSKQYGFWLEYSYASRLESALARESSMQESAAILDEAVELLRGLGGLPYGMVLAASGRAKLFLGDVQGAIAAQEEASDIFFLLNNSNWLLLSRLSLVYSFIQIGARDRALSEIQEVLVISEEKGLRDARAEAYSYLGEVHRHDFQFKEALEAYEKAYGLMKDWDPPNIASTELNMALCFLGMADYEKAHSWFMKLKNMQLSHVAIEGALELALCATTAYYGKWKSWDMHWSRAQSLLKGAIDFDLGFTSELAADITQERGQVERARALYTYAASIWRTLGRDADLARVQGKL